MQGTIFRCAFRSSFKLETILAKDNETLKQIADKLDVDVTILLSLNKPYYKGLTKNAKLQAGTEIDVPVGNWKLPDAIRQTDVSIAAGAAEPQIVPDTYPAERAMLEQAEQEQADRAEHNQDLDAPPSKRLQPQQSTEASTKSPRLQPKQSTDSSKKAPKRRQAEPSSLVDRCAAVC